jgi:hypothetical protein
MEPRAPIASIAPPQGDDGAEAQRRATRNQRRRERYENDPAYRQRCIDRAAGYVKRSRKHPRRGGEDERAWRVVVVKNWTTGELKRESVGTLVALSRALGVRRETILSWEKREILPEPAYTTEHGWRLYSPEMIEAAADAFKISRMKATTRSGRSLILFRALLAERWERLRAGLRGWNLAGGNDGEEADNN